MLLTEDGVLADSTEILGWVDQKSGGSLYGEDPKTRELEDLFDERLGPHTRRLAYFHLLDAPRFAELFDQGTPRVKRWMFRRVSAVVRKMIRKSYQVDLEGAERSRVRVRQVFANVARQLDDGRRYLVGDRFTAADLTFAAMAAPVLIPENYGYALPPSEEIPPALKDERDTCRDTIAGRFALRLYAEDRG